MKSPLQTNLENFICMLSQDYGSMDKDIRVPTIHKLLMTIDKAFFEHVKLINWFDVQSLVQQFYNFKNLDLNAMEDIRAQEIEAGEKKPLVEALIILSSLVKMFNEAHYLEIKDYFKSNADIPPDQDFFDYVDDVYEEVKDLVSNAHQQKRESMMSIQKKKENENTQHLLNMISNKNEVIHQLQNENKELNVDIEKYLKKIKELNNFLEKNQFQQEESTKNLQMQEKIFESKIKLMEEDTSKVKEDYEKRIKKMVTNNDLEREEFKRMIKAWNEEKASIQKELKKLNNEKAIAEKSLSVKNMDITDLKKENKTLANKVKSLEIKTKSSINWRNRHDKLKAENKNLNEIIDELEAKVNSLDRQKLGSKNMFGVGESRSSKNRFNLDILNEVNTSNANNEVAEDLEDSNNMYRIRESEVNLDVYGDVSNSLSQHVTENNTYFGPRDTIPSMGVSPINQINLQDLMYQKVDTVNEETPGQPPQVIVKEKIPEDVLKFEEAGILYAAVSEYLVEHMDLVEYYTSKKTRDRDIMKPFVIEQFFK
jgi:hypothetical protein